jgi:hypothetical protein
MEAGLSEGQRKTALRIPNVPKECGRAVKAVELSGVLEQIATVAAGGVRTATWR